MDCWREDACKQGIFIVYYLYGLFAMIQVTEAEILPRHFEDAVRNARRSVSDRDLQQYSSFAQVRSLAASVSDIAFDVPASLEPCS